MALLGSQLHIEFKVVTPLVLGGAKQDLKGGRRVIAAELRPPSIRGALRFWFRALCGGLDIPGMQALEDRWFGSMRTGQCPVRMRLSHSQLPMRQWRKEGGPDLNYLGFSLDTKIGKGKDQVQVIREYIEPASTFGVDLVSHDRDALKVHWSSAWLLSFLGGLGYRSRRGFGSLSLQQSEGAPFELPLPISAKAVKELPDMLHEGLKSIRTELGRAFPRRVQDYSHFYQGQEVRFVAGEGEGWPNWQEGLHVVEGKLKAKRKEVSRKQKKHFGLPLQGENEEDRHASPLMVHVGELASGKTFVALTPFYAKRLMGEAKPGDAATSPVLRNFLQQFDGGGSAATVL